jgi:septal ring factor EnvC (AmiA/AmiB activator)
MSDDAATLILALALENAELRGQLAEAQDLLVETAVDAGELHARIAEIQVEVSEARSERDAWRLEAERRSGATARHLAG